MNKIFIVDHYKNPGLLRFTQTKLFFDSKNKNTGWAASCQTVDSVQDIKSRDGIIINSGEFVTSTFRQKFMKSNTLIDARNHQDLIRFDPDYTYDIRKRPPYSPGSKHLYILENLYKVVLRSKKLIYLENTESHHGVHDGIYRHLYGLASGWKTIRLFRDLMHNDFESVTVYDSCARQLQFQQHLHANEQLPSSLEIAPPYVGTYDPPEDMKQFWPVWHKTAVKFELIDLFKTPRFSDQSFVWISNVFCYEPTIFEFGWEACQSARERLLSSNKSCTIIET